MTKDVLITISGTQLEAGVEGAEYENIEVVSPATYYFKDGLHYIFYEEVHEGVAGVTKNKITLVENDYLEIVKKGVANSHMRFDCKNEHISVYETPFGNMQMGVETQILESKLDDEEMKIKVSYALAINCEAYAQCEINMKICNKSKGMCS